MSWWRGLSAEQSVIVRVTVTGTDATVVRGTTTLARADKVTFGR